MTELVIRRGSLIVGSGVEVGDILVSDGKIAALGDVSPRRRCQPIDATGLYVAPGFIDTHVNGGGGRGFMECTPEAFATAIGFHKRHGTTGMLPTAVAAPLNRMRDFAELVQQYTSADPAVLGAHLNGPFVSPLRAGAIDAQHILPPTLDNMRNLTRGFENVVQVITLAPEMGAEEVIGEALAIGAAPSLGHSDATYEQTLAAMEQGVRRFTHIFNAMRELGHHEPGPGGAALEAEEVSIELIADGNHVHPVLMRALCNIRHYDGICLVTDAISAAGQQEGEHHLGSVRVVMRDGIATTEQGTLAGSTLTMDRAVRCLVRLTGCHIWEAIRCATLNPARSLGIADRKGTLEEGKDADLVLLDREFRAVYTIVGGTVVHAPQGA